MLLLSRRLFPSFGRTALIISVAALFLTGASASSTASEVTQEPAPGFQSLEGRKIVVLLRDRMDEPDEESRLPLSAGELAWLANTVGVDLEPAGQTRDGGQVLTVMGPLAEGAVREALGDMQLLDGILYANLAPEPFSPAKEAKRTAASNETVTQLIVKLRDAKMRELSKNGAALPSAKLKELSALAGTGLSFVRAMSGDAFVLGLPQKTSMADAWTLCAALEADASVTWAEPDSSLKPALVPEDELYQLQWHYFDAVGGIGAPAAWDVTVGDSGIRIAVIDSGIAPPPALIAGTYLDDFFGRTIGGYDFVSDPFNANDGDGRDADARDPGDWREVGECGSTVFRPSKWHGTRVAGIIGADAQGLGDYCDIANNPDIVACAPIGFHGVGINWVSKMVPIRVSGKCSTSSSDFYDGVRWAAGNSVAGVPENQYPAQVLNVSLISASPSACSPNMQSAINAALARGAVFVSAAGNTNVPAVNYFPANCSGVISVGATDRNADRAPYSNYGTAVDIVAPGGDISACVADPDATECPGAVFSNTDLGTRGPSAETYSRFSSFEGTSMAAPHVSGVLSLMLSENPNLSPSQVQSLLESSATPFPGSSSCDTALCGAGKVNAYAAVEAARQQGLCGNGQVDGTEECDDGNTADGDGCSSSCSVDSGWNCSQAGCNPVCGDGFVDGAEECDDGGTADGDGCSSSCTQESGPGLNCSSFDDNIVVETHALSVTGPVGFNDPTPVSPVGGNTATTLGAQRLAALKHAAKILESEIHWREVGDPEVIFVQAEFGDSLPFCTGDGWPFLGLGGSDNWALTNGIVRPVVLVNHTSESASYSNSQRQIRLFFTLKSGVDCPTETTAHDNGFYYGFDQDPASGQVDFITVAIHEMLHALGLRSMFNKQTGESLFSNNGSPIDPYTLNLMDADLGLGWGDMTPAQRVASITKVGKLQWTGPELTALVGTFTEGVSDGRVQMYAPETLDTTVVMALNQELGRRSIDHFDPALFPDEMMEPFYTAPNHDIGAARALLADIGWNTVAACSEPGCDVCPGNVCFQTCPDIDGCSLDGGTGCGGDANASCDDQGIDSRICTCASGYSGTATLTDIENFSGCTAIDVCATNNGNCGDQAYYTCTNNPGSTPTCTAIDVCATNNGNCGDQASYTCTNNPGGAPTCTAITGTACQGNHDYESAVSALATGCTDIIGNLFINSTSLTSLAGLAGLTSVGQHLAIQENTALTSLEGLGSLVSVDGDIRVYANNALTSLEGLNSLESVGGSFWIDRNRFLTSLEALNSLVSVGGYLRIFKSDALTSLAGLEALSSVGGYFWIDRNPSLTSLEGLGSLESVGGYFRIFKNAPLTSLAGLEALSSVVEYLQIDENASLTSLAGLAGLTSVGGDLLIHDNTLLCQDLVDSFVLGITIGGTTTTTTPGNTGSCSVPGPSVPTMGMLGGLILALGVGGIAARFMKRG